MKSCFLTVGPGPPWQHFLDPHIALHSVLITTVQYRVCDIPVFECADAPADLFPESSLSIHEMSFFGLFL